VTSVRRFGPAEREAVRETLADAHQFVSERVQQLPMTTWMTPVGGGGDVCGGGGDCHRQRSNNTSIPCVERSVEGPRTRVRRVRPTTTREHDDPSSNHRHTITKTKTTTVISNRRQEQCDPMSSVDSDEMCRTSRRNNNNNPEMHMLANHYKEVDDNNTECARIGVTTMEV
jgi:hypothetical protein